jgi:hypothetical protein
MAKRFFRLPVESGFGRNETQKSHGRNFPGKDE